MKGRVVVLGAVGGREAAALVVDGRVEDFLIDPSGDVPVPGTIFRAVVGRPLKGQGGAMVDLGQGNGFFRAARGLRQGQALTVQVTAFAEPGKAPPVTDRLMLKGRGAIVTPLAPGINLSRRLRDDAARIRLHDLATGVLGGRNWGVILRSAAEGLDDDALAGELEHLLELADRIMAEEGTEPERLLDGPGAHGLAWRDWSDPAPDAVEEGAEAFDRLDVPGAIEAASGAHEALAGGAGIYVEPTRALVAVDVNTGGDTGPAAALKANQAAARALPRALRLRGLGGQITVDFAPMPKKDRRALEQVLRAAFRADPVETALVGWTPLGHFELQRKRERCPLREG